MESPARLVLCLLPLFGLLAACGGAGNPKGQDPEPLRLERVVPGSGVRLYQVDFAGEKTVHADTRWGRALIDPAALAKATGIQGGWVNIATADGWAVVNLPLPPVGEPPFAVYFDLGLEKPRHVKSLRACVRHSNQALERIETESRELVEHPVSRWEIAHPGVEVVDPGLPPATRSLQCRVPVPSGIDGWFQMTTNEQCAMHQCATMALANALQYLENMHVIDLVHDHRPGVHGDRTLVGMLDTYSGRWVASRTSPGGVRVDQTFSGTFEYLQDEGLTGLLGHRHQDAGLSSSFPAGDYSDYGSTSRDDGGAPTFEWIYERMGEGCGVAAKIAYVGASGHAVRITAAYVDDTSRQWIRFAHDACQTHCDPTDTLGLESVVHEFGDFDGDGIPNLGSPGIQLLNVWAHCP